LLSDSCVRELGLCLCGGSVSTSKDFFSGFARSLFPRRVPGCLVLIGPQPSFHLPPPAASFFLLLSWIFPGVLYALRLRPSSLRFSSKPDPKLISSSLLFPLNHASVRPPVSARSSESLLPESAPGCLPCLPLVSSGSAPVSP
jgi:hypothetical protein